MKASNIIKNKPYLIWYTKNYDSLSDESVIEAVINYGDWEDWRQVFNYCGKDKIKKFIKSKAKSQFRKGTLNLISLLLNIGELKYKTRGDMIINDIKNKAAKNAYKIIYDGTYKDYLNIYQTLKIGFLNLEDIRKITEGKYKSEFNFRILLEKLIDLEDIKETKTNHLGIKISKKELEEFFKKEVKKLSLAK